MFNCFYIKQFNSSHVSEIIVLFNFELNENLLSKTPAFVYIVEGKFFIAWLSILNMNFKNQTEASRFFETLQQNIFEEATE